MREYFTAVYKNDATRERIGRALEENRLAHTLLICGPEGSGKKTLALEIAAAVCCEMRDDAGQNLPCGKCNTCRRIHERNHPDVKYIQRQRDKATIGIDPVRELREDAYLTPTEAPMKIYVIEEADKLTPQAQNAFLITLEEPPSPMLTILVATERDKLLDTVRSRAQLVTMQRLDNDTLRAYMLNREPAARMLESRDGAAFDGLIMSADGCIGKAAELIKEGVGGKAAQNRSTADSFIAALPSTRPYSALLQALSYLPSSRLEFTESLETIVTALRDLVLIKLDRNAPLLFYTTRDAAREAASALQTKRLLDIYDIIIQALEDNRKNASVAVIVSSIAMKIKLA